MNLILNNYIIIIFFILFNLAVGSLLNVIIFRLPHMMFENSNINLWFPRSFCTSCKKTISAWHNIPIISYFLLGGACYSCKQKIHWRYPLIEAMCLGLSLCALYKFGFTIALIYALLFIYYNICIIFIDLDHKIIPDSLSLGLLWIGLIANTQNIFTLLPHAIFAAVGAYLSLWILINLYAFFTGKIGMGNGDFKLFAALGAWFGIYDLSLILLIASAVGLFLGLIYLKITKQGRDTQIPFGPFLSIAGFFCLFSYHPL